jgi:hypothetical protein
VEAVKVRGLPAKAVFVSAGTNMQTHPDEHTKT